MSEWKPIETAPRDGTPIFVWPVNSEIGKIPYVVVAYEHFNGEKLFTTWIEASGEMWATFGDVTHWQPLPAPPAS